jgi:transcriptional regulator with XRE-family HTH domain
MDWMLGCMKFRGWNIATLERVSGVRRRTIERTLGGQVAPQLGTVHRLADAFGVDRLAVEQYLDGLRPTPPLPTTEARLTYTVSDPALQENLRRQAEITGKTPGEIIAEILNDAFKKKHPEAKVAATVLKKRKRA